MQNIMKLLAGSQAVYLHTERLYCFSYILFGNSVPNYVWNDTGYVDLRNFHTAAKTHDSSWWSKPFVEIFNKFYSYTTDSLGGIKLMVVKLYKADISPVARACMMACGLLNVPTEMIDVDLFKREHLFPEFVKKNPLHAVPVLEDGDLIINDSHAILMYLAEKYDKDGSLYPKDINQRALVNHKLFFSISMVYMRLRDITGPLILEGEKPSEKRFKAIEETYGFLEEFLSRTKYLAGDSMTIADIAAFASGVALGFLVELDGEKYPKLQAWMTTMKQMPVSQKFNAPGHNAYEEFIKKLLAA